MKNLLCIIIFAHATAAWSQDKPQPRWELSGRITSEAGKPLAGVLLNDDIRTDNDGRYKIELSSFPRNGFSIQFRFSGYRTTTKAIISANTHQLDVIMQPGNNIWLPQLCNQFIDNSKRIGWHMKVLVPEGTEIERNSGADTESIGISFLSGKGLEWMLLGTGPLWGGGSPPLHLLISPKDIKEQELLVGEKRGIDFRVLDKDGGRWRETGFFTETMSYSNVSDQAAAFFDSVIDTMCWDPDPMVGTGFDLIPSE
jgi:hypothetical protein